MPSWLKMKTKNYCYKLKNHVMKKNLRHLILSVAAIMALSGCQEKLRNTEELVDPWLRERTPVNVRLDRQIGPAIISSDWRTDSLGTVSVSLVTPELDMSAVKVVALDFAYPESEHCPSASIKPGDTIDLSDGFEEFVVTAKTGETRTYTITYTNFKDPLEGTYSFTPVTGILTARAADSQYFSSMVMVGGYKNNPVATQIMDKDWQWDHDHNPRHEDDNILSFRLDRADDQTGFTYGTFVNIPGADGKFADYIWNADLLYGENNDKIGPKYDMNDKYRLIAGGKSAVFDKNDKSKMIEAPTPGKGRWSKLGDGKINFYHISDTEYKTPLYSLDLLESGEYNYWEEEDLKKKAVITVPNIAFHRSFGEGPFEDYTDVVDAWIYITNVRNVFWLVKMDQNSAIDDHAEWLDNPSYPAQVYSVSSDVE